MSSINHANTNSLWSSILAECLYRSGLKQVVISPGSRSTPLTVAFAQHPDIEAIPVLDERSAGFFALGLAKQLHQPVALICTSGTAAVNYFPAVVEASEARVPLLVLTADRPPELRDCGAGQTIDQIRLYGNYPVFQEEMDIPDASIQALERMRDQIVGSYGEAFSGPVHLNCPFRDPLPPTRDGTVPEGLSVPESFFASIPLAGAPEPTPDSSIEMDSLRGLIICGTESPKDPALYSKTVAELAEASGWPVLSDGLSPVRNYGHLFSELISSYDLILRNSKLRESLRPQQVIALGPLPTSKELRKWLGESDTEILHVHQTGKNLDPTGKVVQVLALPVENLVEVFQFQQASNTDYRDLWTSAQSKATPLLAQAFAGHAASQFEGRLAWQLPEWLPERTPLFVASSMPVRDVEYFWPANSSRTQVYASRGVNGIDGTLSTALGIAHGNRPSVLLTGDLAFLHDSNGLLIRPKFKGHLTVLLINNRGGGIFNHLPIARFEPPFEEFFGTPQEVDFKALVESTGADYHKLGRMEELAELLSNLPEEGIRVIEIETNRHQDSEYRKELFRSISPLLV